MNARRAANRNPEKVRPSRDNSKEKEKTAQTTALLSATIFWPFRDEIYQIASSAFVKVTFDPLKTHPGSIFDSQEQAKNATGSQTFTIGLSNVKTGVARFAKSQGETSSEVIFTIYRRIPSDCGLYPVRIDLQKTVLELETGRAYLCLDWSDKAKQQDPSIVFQRESDALDHPKNALVVENREGQQRLIAHSLDDSIAYVFTLDLQPRISEHRPLIVEASIVQTDQTRANSK
jgi:hypothetical protein